MRTYEHTILSHYPERKSITKDYVIRKYKLKIQELRLRITRKMVNTKELHTYELSYCEGYNQALKEAAQIIDEERL